MLTIKRMSYIFSGTTYRKEVMILNKNVINTYSFEDFILDRNHYDDYQDNAFLKKMIKFYTDKDFPNINDKMKALSKWSSTEYREIINHVAKRENQPRIEHYDAYNNRIDNIIRPKELIDAEQKVFAEKLFSGDTNNWEQMIKRFLLHHNGEGGIMCPVACTDGLVDLLNMHQHELTESLQNILIHCTEGIEGDFGIGAQFMTEIQGGSNIPANELHAEQAGDHYRLYGTKFFCSAIHADYAVVTARVANTNHVATFIVPSWKNKKREKRNNFQINRLKWKLGTSELPSAEITYDGASAYQIGALEKGVAIAVGIVLTKSRLDIGSASAAFMMRTAREVLQYTSFRQVFGKSIHAYPLAAAQIQTVVQTAKRTTAGVFKVYDRYLKSRYQAKNTNTDQAKKVQFQVRELILLQKIKAAKDAVETIRLAISLFGGNGVIEDFSSIPRLYRDAMVNELWEGPRNVLLTQIHRDMQKAASWYDPEDFIGDILTGCNYSIIDQFSHEMTKLLTYDLSAEPNNETIRQAEEWENFCDNLFLAYQEQALSECGDASIVEGKKSQYI